VSYQPSEKSVLEQLRRRKWNWIGHTLRRSYVSIAKQVLQWTPQGHRGRGRPSNTWKRDLEREMWTAGSRFSWKKMETAAQDRAGWRRVVCGLLSGLDVTRHKSVSQSVINRFQKPVPGFGTGSQILQPIPVKSLLTTGYLQALEKFSGTASEVATRLRQLCGRLEDTQFPNDVTQTELLIAEHDAARRDLKRDLETVIEQGEQLLVCFKTTHYHGNKDTVVLATQLLPASRLTQVMAVERYITVVFI